MQRRRRACSGGRSTAMAADGDREEERLATETVDDDGERVEAEG
jgi:hypothetical protein